MVDEEDNAQGSKGCKGITAYNLVIREISDVNSNLLGLQPLLPLQPSNDNIASDSVQYEEEYDDIEELWNQKDKAYSETGRNYDSTKDDDELEEEE